MITVTSASAAATRAIGEAFAGALEPGTVVLLTGDLGAGKTTFVQGVGAALGVTEQMTSPTFTLVRTYEGRLSVAHVDAWRLEHLREVLDLGLDELLDDGAVALIEWGEAIEPAIGRPVVSVRIDPGEADDERIIMVAAAVPPGLEAVLRAALDGAGEVTAKA